MKNSLKNYGLIIAATAFLSAGVGYYAGHCTSSIKNKPGKGGSRFSTQSDSSTACDETTAEITSNCAKKFVWNYGDWAGRVAYKTKESLDRTRQIPPEAVISYWTIDLSEIDALKQHNPSVSKICAYLGFNKPHSFNKTISDSSLLVQIGEGLNELHLILVPGFSDGTLGEMQPEPEKSYDLIKPCPSTCDTKSFLSLSYNIGFKNGYNSSE